MRTSAIYPTECQKKVKLAVGCYLSSTSSAFRQILMNCVILQPSYIPWRGYFHQIYKADVFVFYDDVQYDHHGWRNRNRIKTPAGPKWLTIPLRSTGANWKNRMIRDMQVSQDENWSRKHLETLRHSYSKAPYFSAYLSMLERWYATPALLLADFTIDTTIEVARELGIEKTHFVRSSALACQGAKTERLLAILQKVGATHYISGPAAKGYLDVEMLCSAGIGVEWMVYEYPEYPQLFPPFDPQISVLDLLFNVGSGARRFIWQL
jgi:WbqC-like protein family